MALPKLVRDNIPSIIERSGRKCTWSVASNDTYVSLLFEKMYEECAELREEKSLEEAADVYEVFVSLLSALDLNMSEVIKFAENKRLNNGSFSNRIILNQVN